MKTSYGLLLSCLHTAFSQDTNNEAAYNGILDDYTFISILVGTGLCLTIVIVLVVVIAFLKMRQIVYTSVPFNIQKALSVTHARYRNDKSSENLPKPKIKTFVLGKDMNVHRAGGVSFYGV